MRLAALLVVFSGIGAFAQPSLVVGQERSFGVAMAVNPKNNRNIVVYANTKVWYSTDGGKAWQQSAFTPGGFGLPSLVADPKGNFFFADVTENKSERPGVNAVSVFRSEDGGKTWSAPSVVMASDNQLLYASLGVHPKKEQVAITWTELVTSEECQSTLYFSMSTNAGKKFAEPTVLSQAQADCADNGSVLRSAPPATFFDGKLFVTWLQSNKMMLDRSYDHNIWLRNDITVRDNVGSWLLPFRNMGTIINVPSIGMDNSNTKTKGLLSVVYGAKGSGRDDLDVYMIRSGNRGDNWTTPFRVNDDSLSHDQFLPRFAIDQQESTMYVMYFGRSAEEDTVDVYLAWSVDGGSTFREKKLSTEPSRPLFPDNLVSLQQYSALSAVNGVVVATWVHWDEGEKGRVLCLSIPRSELEK